LGQNENKRGITQEGLEFFKDLRGFRRRRQFRTRKIGAAPVHGGKMGVIDQGRKFPFRAVGAEDRRRHGVGPVSPLLPGAGVGKKNGNLSNLFMIRI